MRSRGNLKLAQQHGFGYMWGELVLGCLAVIRGKVHKLDDLYLLKETHAGNADWPDRDSADDIFSWITGSEFSPKYQAFQACLTEELVRQEGLSVEQAQAVVKHGFWSYLEQSLRNKWRERYRTNAGIVPSPRQTLRRIPGLRQAWGKARGFLPGEANQMTLSALSRPTSPYYQDFKLIYQAIATGVTP